MSTSRQGMTSTEIDQIVAQRFTDAIEAIAIYEAIRMARDLMNQFVRQGTTVEKNANNKRMFENQPKDNRLPRQPPCKKPGMKRAYTIGANKRRAYARNLPYCNKWMYKLDLEPLPLKLRKNREAHVDCLKQTKEHANTLCDIIEQARAEQPLDSTLDYDLVPPKKPVPAKVVKKTPHSRKKLEKP
nr:hypothetical protein [Tanacetum cinerariifolium]